MYEYEWEKWNREHAETGNMMSFVVNTTITGQIEFQDFLNTKEGKEIGEFGTSFKITLCLTKGFLFNCTFAPCPIPVRI